MPDETRAERNGRPTVAIVDNDRFTRMAMRRLLIEDGRLDILWDRSGGLVAEHLVMVRESRPDVLLLDMSLGETAGVEVCRAIRSRVADLRILGITAFPPDMYAADLAAAGAQGLVTKENDREVLAGIHTLLNGGVYCPSVPDVVFHTAMEAFRLLHDGSGAAGGDGGARERFEGAPPHGSVPVPSVGGPSPAGGRTGESRHGAPAGRGSALSAREREVLASYACTGSYKITARALGVSESTARNIMAHVRRKLGVTNTATAIVAWYGGRGGEM